MEQTSINKRHFRLKYGLSKNSFWAGLLNFFCLHDHPYNNAVQKIAGSNTEDALKNDLFQLKEDFHNALQKTHR